VRETTHRYLVERSFPAGALDGLHAEGKTYCTCEGLSEAAVREAAAANEIPVDSVTEVPVTLLPN
jgi:hypothetical protein